MMGLFGTSAKEHAIKGNAFFQKKQFDDAIKELKEATRKEPNNPDYHNDLGLCYANKARYDDAVGEYNIAVKLQPNHALAHQNLGFLYIRKGLWDESIIETRLSLKINPSNANVHNNLAIALIEKGQYDEALIECREANRLQAQPVFFYNAGLCLEKKGLLEAAIVDFRTAVRLAPNNNMFKDRLALAEEKLRAQIANTQGPMQNQVVREKEIIREIVKMPCKYCNALVEVTAAKCPNCGAPL